MVTKYKICSRNILRHSNGLTFNICMMTIYNNCIPLDEKEYNDMLSKDDSWICKFSISYALPYCWIEDDIAHEYAIIKFCDGIPDINGRFKDNVFIPCELSEFDKRLPLFDVDPDLYFFNHIHKTINQFSNYYVEETFKEKNRCSV